MVRALLVEGHPQYPAWLDTLTGQFCPLVLHHTLLNMSVTWGYSPPHQALILLLIFQMMQFGTILARRSCF